MLHKCKSIAAGTDIPPIFLFVVKAAAAAVSHAWKRRFAATTISGSLLQQRVLALLLQAMILVYVQFCVLHSARCEKFFINREKVTFLKFSVSDYLLVCRFVPVLVLPRHSVATGSIAPRSQHGRTVLWNSHVKTKIKRFLKLNSSLDNQFWGYSVIEFPE